MAHNINRIFSKGLILVFACLLHNIGQAKPLEQGIRVLSPNGNELVYNQDKLKVEWETPDSTIAGLNIVLVDKLNQEHLLVANVPNTGTYTLTNEISSYVGEYQLKLKEVNGTAEDEGNGKLTLVDVCLKSEYNSLYHYAGLHTKLNRTSFKTNSNLLCFRLQETNRHVGVTTATIIDAKKRTKAIVGLEKSFGYNHYTLDLNSPTLEAQGLNVEEGNTYFMEAADGYGTKKVLKFQYVVVPNVTNDIIGNVRFASCETSNATEVEYLPAIFEGTAPYKLEWHVSPTQDEAQATRTQKNTIGEKTNTLDTQFGNINPHLAKFIVTDDPGYYVILVVTDNCGKTARKVAHITCDEHNNNNTISIQLIDNSPTNTSY